MRLHVCLEQGLLIGVDQNMMQPLRFHIEIVTNAHFSDSCCCAESFNEQKLIVKQARVTMLEYEYLKNDFTAYFKGATLNPLPMTVEYLVNYLLMIATSHANVEIGNLAEWLEEKGADYAAERALLGDSHVHG